MKKQFIVLLSSLFLLFSCSKDSTEQSSDNGTGGSMARFVLVDNFLYVVDVQKLMTYDVTVSETPVLVQTQELQYGIETLYPYENYLLIGSTTGMYIYEIQSNGVPSYISEYEHIETCDPVVTNGNYAYVTLRSNRTCGGSVAENNRLEIIDIQNPTSPNLVNQLWLDNPKGLGLDGNLLFICVGNEGIHVFDITQETDPVLLTVLDGFVANDVIAKDDHLLVVCPDGLRQFDYSDIQNINDLSYFAINF